MTSTTAIREGERMGNRLNAWHLVAEDDSGHGAILTRCGRKIDQPWAHMSPRESVECEGETSRVRRCKRCWR